MDESQPLSSATALTLAGVIAAMMTALGLFFIRYACRLMAVDRHGLQRVPTRVPTRRTHKKSVSDRAVQLRQKAPHAIKARDKKAWRGDEVERGRLCAQSEGEPGQVGATGTHAGLVAAANDELLEDALEAIIKKHTQPRGATMSV